MNNDSLTLVRTAAQALADKKGHNIIALDVRGVSTMTDFLVIADGTVDRHVLALASHVSDVMRQAGERPIHAQGQITGDWVVLDYGSIIIHIFETEMRDRYRLEELWHDGSLVDLSLT